MKRATADDIWRSIYKRNDFPILRLEVEFENVIALGTGALRFDGPLSLLCGENGVGKTTALRVLHRALADGAGGLGLSQSGVAASALSGTIVARALTVRDADGERRLTSVKEIADFIPYKEAGQGIQIQFLDTASLIPRLQRDLREDENRADLVNGVSARVLAGKELAFVQHLIGREYEEVSVFEVEEYGDYERVPYFMARYSGQVYGAETMGTGELSLLYLYWAIDTMLSGSVLLLEEPESFVAPRSQSVLIDWIAAMAIRKKAFVIVASHSSHIADRFPLSHVTLCSRQERKVVAERPAPAHALRDRLGILSDRRVFFLVEDQVACEYLWALLSTFVASVSADCEIAPCKGSSEIGEILSRMPRFPARRTWFVGVYDPDQQPPALAWPTLRLPGTGSPESVLRQFLQGADLAEVSAYLRVSEERLRGALGGSSGAEVHEWLARVCGELRVAASVLFMCLAETWKNAANTDAKKFVAELSEAIRAPE